MELEEQVIKTRMEEYARNYHYSQTDRERESTNQSVYVFLDGFEVFKETDARLL